MTIQAFIEHSFLRIQQVFPNVAIAYQYVANAETHFIKVTPKSIFDYEQFIDIDFELTDLFNQQGFSEILCFVSSDALVTIDQPSKVYSPKPNSSYIEWFQYQETIATTVNISIPLAEIKQQTPESSFPDSFSCRNLSLSIAA